MAIIILKGFLYSHSLNHVLGKFLLTFYFRVCPAPKVSFGFLPAASLGLRYGLETTLSYFMNAFSIISILFFNLFWALIKFTSAHNL